MTVSVMGAGMGFVVGAVLAGMLNLELFGYASDVARKRGEGTLVMRWIMRSLLVVAPLALAAIGYVQAETILGGLA